MDSPVYSIFEPKFFQDAKNNNIFENSILKKYFNPAVLWWVARGPAPSPKYGAVIYSGEGAFIVWHPINNKNFRNLGERKLKNESRHILGNLKVLLVKLNIIFKS